MVYLENPVREEFPDSRLRKETEGTDVYPPAFRMVKADKLYLVRIKHGKVKGAHFVVHYCGKNFELPAALCILYCFRGK